VEALKTEVEGLDTSEISISVVSLTESHDHCREMLHDHLSQLQYLIDLHDKVHKVMSACCPLFIPAIQTMWAVVRPVQAVTGDIFIRTVRPQCELFLSAPNRTIITYLLTYFNIVTLCLARLVPGWVTVFGQVNYLGM